MSVIEAWVAFPLIMAALSLGLGLLVRAGSGAPIPGTLLIPIGFAAFVVVAQAMTASSASARFVTPVVAALAAFGLIAAGRPTRPRPSWAAASALGVFAAFAAPVVLSGGATLAGWIKLDDTATWLALIDRLMEHGRSIAGLPHSSYEVTLSEYLTTGYPVGSFVPLGVGGQLARQNIAWLVDPYLAFLAALLSLSLYAVASRILTSRVVCALTGFIGAQAAIFYGYALWGGIKEVAGAPLIALTAALVPSLLGAERPGRAAIPLAVGTAATFAALSLGGGLWLAPILLSATVLLFRAMRPRNALGTVAVFGAVTAVLSIPTLAIASTFQTTSTSVLTSGKELGNLIHPLKLVQVLGIWPTGDFRLDPPSLGPTYALIAVVAAVAAFAVFSATRRRRFELGMYVGSALVGAIVLVVAGSPWVGAKGLATASPALVAASVIGGGVLLEGGRRVEGIVALLLVSGGVLWSNVLQYHDVSLAPREQLSELATIGSTFAGDGPTLMTEYSPYGSRHLLYRLDPESASEFRWRLVPLLDGTGLDKGGSADIDQFQTSGILVYRTLVLRRSATASRPPSIYNLVWQGKTYEVWQRPESGFPRILEHLPLGNRLDPAAIPSCSDVHRLATLAGPGGRLAAVERPETSVAELGTGTLPPGWTLDQTGNGAVIPSGAGTVETTVTIPQPGLYSIWLGGSFQDGLDLSVDGRHVFSARDVVNWPGIFQPAGAEQLTGGTHRVSVHLSGPDIHPGSGGKHDSLGPIVFGTTTANTPVTYVAPDAAGSLCGLRLDWVEAIGT